MGLFDASLCYIPVFKPIGIECKQRFPVQNVITQTYSCSGSKTSFIPQCSEWYDNVWNGQCNFGTCSVGIITTQGSAELIIRSYIGTKAQVFATPEKIPVTPA